MFINSLLKGGAVLPESQTDYLTYIRRNHILRDLTDEELHLVIMATTPRRFPTDAVIMQEGEAGEVMYIMCEGSVAITKRLTLELGEGTPREKVMVRFRAEEGVILGEMALIESEVRSATVTALTPCLMLELTKDKFYQILEKYPKIGVKILLRLAQSLSQRLRKNSDELVKVTTALAIALES